jgi:hypothetical protein
MAQATYGRLVRRTTMFVTTERSGCNDAGEQVCHGLFLIIFNIQSGGELRCIIRHARMRQCGHWMMASVQVGSEKLVLSGTYGGDGLPYLDSKGETERLWDRLHILPADLTEAFWNGGGHNCAGTEGPLIQAWARERIQDLRKLKEIP